MAKIDKYFLNFSSEYDYSDKKKNNTNSIAYMFNRTSTMFEYENLPKTIPYKELEKILQSTGFGIFTKIDDDFYVVSGGLGGVTDVYNRPTNAIVSVPYLNYNKTLTIGEDCVIIMNDITGTGLKPIFDKYINLLNENEISILLATVNNRIQTLISANDDSTVESAETFLKNIYEGKLGVIAESQLFDSLKVNHKTTNNSISELIELEQYLKASLYNEIGLSANYNMKKERLINAEVELNNDVLFPLLDDMLECREQALNEINELYGLNISVKFGNAWAYRNNVIEPVQDDLSNDNKEGEPVIEDEEIIEPMDDTEDTEDKEDTEDTEDTEEEKDKKKVN